MNFLTPVTSQWLETMTKRQPAMLSAGMRVPEVALRKFRSYTREELRTQGLEVEACNPDIELKGWIDIDAKPGETKTYSVLTEAGVVPLEMSGEEALMFNLAGEPKWPVPDRLMPSGVKFKNNYRSGTVKPEELSTREEAEAMLADLGPGFWLIKPSDVSPLVEITVTAEEKFGRYPWVIRADGGGVPDIQVGTTIQEQFVKFAKGAPGKWVIDPALQGGVRYELAVIATTSAHGILPVPIGPVPAGAVVESNGSLGGGLQVFLPEKSAAGNSTTQDEILASLKRIENALGIGSGPSWL